MFGDRKELESVRDTNLDVWQHRPGELVFDLVGISVKLRFNFFCMIFVSVVVFVTGVCDFSTAGG